MKRSTSRTFMLLATLMVILFVGGLALVLVLALR